MAEGDARGVRRAWVGAFVCAVFGVAMRFVPPSIAAHADANANATAQRPLWRAALGHPHGRAYARHMR
jgi:hypothetical protein